VVQDHAKVRVGLGARDLDHGQDGVFDGRWRGCGLVRNRSLDVGVCALGREVREVEEVLVRWRRWHGIVVLVWERDVTEEAVVESPAFGLAGGDGGVGFESGDERGDEFAGAVDLCAWVRDEEDAAMVSRC
jgi:hypothetical protein